MEIFTLHFYITARIPLSDSVFTSQQSSMVLRFPTQPICYFGSRNNDTKLGVVCLVTHTGSNRRRTKECQNKLRLTVIFTTCIYNGGKQNWPFFEKADFSINNAINPTNLGAK